MEFNSAFVQTPVFMIDRQATERLIRLANTFRSVAVASPRQNNALPGRFS